MTTLFCPIRCSFSCRQGYKVAHFKIPNKYWKDKTIQKDKTLYYLALLNDNNPSPRVDKTGVPSMHLAVQPRALPFSFWCSSELLPTFSQLLVVEPWYLKRERKKGEKKVNTNRQDFNCKKSGGICYAHPPSPPTSQTLNVWQIKTETAAMSLSHPPARPAISF